jgi:transposase
MPRWGVKWVGLDVARDAIAVGVLDGSSERAPRLEKVAHDEVSIRRLVSRLGEPSRLRVCYEAGPTGYELYRLLASIGVACDVVAPSLVPVAPGDKVKTDRRDARRLVRLYRAGELVAVRVPTREEEGCRDLCRLRGAAVFDRGRARQRLASLLLRRHLVYRDGSTWTLKHRRWLRSLSFDDPGTHATFAHLLASVEERELRVIAIDADLAGFFERGLFVDEVTRLAAYRGIDQLSALAMASEVCDWRRFPAAAKFMGFVGLVPSEYSTGATTLRYGITKAGKRTSATRWSKPRGHINIRRGSAPSSSVASKACLPTSWLVPGLPRSGCVDGSNVSRRAKTAAPLSPPRLPANSPGSCGPR